eukprot:m.2240 g.2240  ORF g.2240 m.2240 type:complete len:519 (-) comp1741_c0_seq1:603-2159(-)
MDKRREYVEILVQEEFGPLIAKVVKVLLVYPSTLYTLTMKTGLNVRDVRKALLVLLQHNLINVHQTRRRPMYTMKEEEVVLRGGISLFSQKVRSVLGTTAEKLFRRFFFHGTSRLSHVMQELRLANSSLSSGEMVKAFTELVDGHFLQRVDTGNVDLETYKQTQFMIPRECATLELEQSTPTTTKKSKMLGDDEENEAEENIQKEKNDGWNGSHQYEDKGVYWGVCFPMILRLLLVDDVVFLCKGMFEETAANVIKAVALLDVKFGHEMHRNATFSPQAVHSKLASMGITMQAKDVKEWLELLAIEFLQIATVYEGKFGFDWNRASNKISVLQAEKYIHQGFGEKSLRLLRLLFDKHLLDQEAIVHIAKVENFGGTRLLLNELFQQGFATYQDVPMSADRAPSRCIYLWESSPSLVIRRIVEHFFQTMVNLMTKQHHERETNTFLLSRKDVLLRTEYTEEDIDKEEHALQATHIKRTLSDKTKLLKVLGIFEKLQISALMTYRQLITLQYPQSIGLGK